MRVQWFVALASIFTAASAAAQQIPRTWDETALADWATPVAGLNVRPTHMPAKEYYTLPVENLRTYPVYYPGREPDGYWEMLQHVGPKPLIEPERLKTEADWIEAGRRVFDEVDHLPLRTLEPKFIAAARNRETFDTAHFGPLPDGTVLSMRWVPTAKGVALSYSNCANCHLLYLADGTRVPGAPTFARPRNLVPLMGAVHVANRVIPSAVPFRMGDEPWGMWQYRAFGVPGVKDDVHEWLKTRRLSDFQPGRQNGGGGIGGWN